jgi:ADP-heptose:LPS heptosyltransferase
LHILIIRPGAIGDSLLAFPVIQALRTRYSSSHPRITLIGNAAVLPLALAFGLAQEVADYGHLHWSELFSTEGIHTPELCKQLQQTDLAICWLRDSHGIVEHNLRLAGVKQVIVAPGRPPEGKRTHVVDYLAETVGVKQVRRDPIYRVPRAGWRGRAHESAPSDPYDRCIAIHPGSGGTQKCWPVASFAAVIECLWQRDYPILLLAGPSDHERLSALQLSLSSSPEQGMLNVLIDAPLVVVAEHLQQCSCYLGNDSGITHLAAMLGIPTIALFGPSDPLIWRPLGPHVEVLQKPTLEQLPVNMVIESILRRL